MIVESSFRGWEDARIVLSERGDFVVLGKNSCYNTKKQRACKKVHWKVPFHIWKK